MSELITDEFKTKYLVRRRDDLEILILSLEKKEFEDIKRIGHQIKGNAETFEFSELALIGANLERYANEQNLELLTSEIDKFKMWLKLRLSEYKVSE